MRILLSNDDGIHATGLELMYRALKRLGEVRVVAPLEERSTTGHSLTIHKPLRMIQMKEHFFGVSGSPADCVYLGIREVFKRKPDIVVSGINRGANLGQDIYYSGTVSAAREACIFGIPSFAVSLVVQFGRNLIEEKLNYETAARVAVSLIRQADQFPLPYHTLLNINVPDVPFKRIRGIRLVRQGFRHYGGSILKRKDHRGKDYYWVGGQYKGYREEVGTDCAVVADNYVAVTPLKLDVTDFGYINKFENDFKEKQKF